MVLCYVVAFDCKAAFGVAASWAAAAAVAHYVGAAVEAALGCVSKLWVVATAVAQLLNDWMTAVLTFGLIILAAYLASAALTSLVQVSGAQLCCPGALPWRGDEAVEIAMHITINQRLG